MRRADIDAAWNGCRRQPLQRLSGRGIIVDRNGTEDEILITSRVSAIVGRNGAGKSSFLRQLCDVLQGQAPTTARPRIHRVRLQIEGVNMILGDQNPPLRLPSAECFDPSREAHTILSYVRHLADFEEVLNQTGLKSLSDKERGLYKFACGRNYDEIWQAEIDGPVDPGLMSASAETEGNVLPFFRVQESGLSYDTRTMGFGELCAFVALWKANRADNGSILLLDEPDAHLSAFGRRALIDTLAFIANEKRLWIIFTSHSIETLSSMREPEIGLLYLDSEHRSPALTSIDKKRRVVRELGLTQTRKLLLLVEDIDGVEVVSQILGRWADDIVRLVDIQIVQGGADAVAAFLSKFPENSKICRAIAVLDGDMREKFADRSDILFLPGNGDPIASAREAVSADCNTFATKLDVAPVRMREALARCAYGDHHDFCALIAGEVAVDGAVPRVRSALVAAWLSDSPQNAELRTLAREISTRFDAIPIGD